MANKTTNCAKCPYKVPDRLCRIKSGKYPVFCPTQNIPDLIDQSRQEYNNSPDILELAKQAALQEIDGYINKEYGFEKLRASKTRIEEIMEFAKKMDYRKLGLAFCIGLRSEAKTVEQVFYSQGFETVSVLCKVGRIPKKQIGLTNDQQIASDTSEAICNPILQALILNNENTEFNILLGLCVGHDSLFFKYTKAPCTVLAVKDRLLGHNPIAAIYNANSYYRCIK